MANKRKFFDKIPETSLFLVLFGIFFYFSMKSFLNFWNQPLTTKLSYTLGESNEIGNHKIKFPVISICNYEFQIENEILQKCANGSNRFLWALKFCYENDKDFKFDAFMKSVDYDR